MSAPAAGPRVRACRQCKRGRIASHLHLQACAHYRPQPDVALVRLLIAIGVPMWVIVGMSQVCGLYPLFDAMERLNRCADAVLGALLPAPVPFASAAEWIANNAYKLVGAGGIAFAKQLTEMVEAAVWAAEGRTRRRRAAPLDAFGEPGCVFCDHTPHSFTCYIRERQHYNNRLQPMYMHEPSP